MAILFMDGFSHYALADITKKWTAKNDTNTTWTLPAEGRLGSCIKRVCTVAGAGGYLTISPKVNQTGVWALQASGVCGFAIKVDDLTQILPGVDTNSKPITNGILNVWNGEWGMFGVGLNANGTLTAYEGLSNALLMESIGALQSGVWCYLEFMWTISQTTGSLIIRANEKIVLTYSGKLYPASSIFVVPPPTAHWSSVNILGVKAASASLTLRACDFYLADTTGTFNNTFLGDINIKYIRPDAVGATTAWTPTGAANNWDCVNEVPADDDTTYNTASAAATLDLYGFEPCGTIEPVALHHCVLARRTAPGSASLQSVTRPVTTNYLSDDQSVTQETYVYNLFPYDTNPETSTTWTTAEIDAAQFGVNKET